MCLEMDVPGVLGRCDVIHRLGIARIGDVDDAEALGEHVADIGKATMHHQLHAIRSATLVGMADEPHLVSEIGFGKIGGRHCEPI